MGKRNDAVARLTTLHQNLEALRVEEAAADCDRHCQKASRLLNDFVTQKRKAEQLERDLEEAKRKIASLEVEKEFESSQISAEEATEMLESQNGA